MEQFFAKDPLNFETLNTEIQASFPNAGLMSDNGGIRVVMPDGTPQNTWDAIGVIVTAHNANVLNEDQKITSAQNAALNNARDYLRKQLLSPGTIPNIYTTVKGYVDGNTHLNAMMATRMTLANLAYGWTVASMTTPANNADRSRYLECVFAVLAVLA
jgi:hypothetical protein